MSDGNSRDPSSLDHLEVVDQEPKQDREVRTEERERIRLLSEDRLSAEERKELEEEAVQGSREVELFEHSWQRRYSESLDEIHAYVDERLGEDAAPEPAPATSVEPKGGQAYLGPEDKERLDRALPGDLLGHDVVYRTDRGYVVRARYEAKDGSERSTLVNLGPGRVSFLEEIQKELDERDVDLSDIDVEAPAPPGEAPPQPTRPSPVEPDEPEEPEPEAGQEPQAPEEAEDEELGELLGEEAGTAEQADQPDQPDQEYSQEDLELAEELGISPEELSDLTGGSEEEKKSGGLGSKLPFGKKKKKAEPEEAGDEEAEEESGGLGSKLPFGKKKRKAEEADEEAEEEAEGSDEEDEEGGGLADKLGFGK